MAKSKPKQEIVDLQIEINKFISRLSKNNISGGIVLRLADVRDNLDNEVSEWYHVDLYTALNPELLLEQARAVYRKRTWWLGYVEVIRNFLVLLPILFTWFALSQASAAYYHAINKTPALATIPFLVQWEQGFNKAVPIWLHFSQVALLDAFILVVIIMITFLVHVENNVLLERAEKKSGQLVAEFDDLLWRISKVLVQRTDPNALSQTLLTSIKDYSESFQEQGEHFQDLLTAEQERLEKLNEFRLQELQEFATVSKDLMDTASQLTKFTSGTKQTFDDLQKLLSLLAGQIQAIPKSQDSLDRTLKSLEGHLGGFESVVKNMIQNLDKGFVDMSLAVHTDLTSLENSVRHVSDNQRDLIQSMGDDRKGDDNVVQRLEVLVDKLEKTSQNYEVYSQHFTKIYADSTIELRTLSENIKDFTAVLKSSSSSPPSSTTMETNMNNLVKELQNLNLLLRKNRLFNFFGSK